jgi:hypothetical protein
LNIVEYVNLFVDDDYFFEYQITNFENQLNFLSLNLQTLTKWSKNLNLRNLVDFQNSLFDIQKSSHHLQTNLHTQLYSILTSFRYCFNKDTNSKRFFYEIS